MELAGGIRRDTPRSARLDYADRTEDEVELLIMKRLALITGAGMILIYIAGIFYLVWRIAKGVLGWVWQEIVVNDIYYGQDRAGGVLMMVLGLGFLLVPTGFALIGWYLRDDDESDEDEENFMDESDSRDDCEDWLDYDVQIEQLPNRQSKQINIVLKKREG